MKRIIRLTESDLTRIVKRVINEGSDSCNYYIIATPYHLEGKGMFIYTGDEGYSMIPMSPWNINRNFIRRIQDEMTNLPKCYEKRRDTKHDLRKIKMGTRYRPDLDWKVVKLDF